MELTYNRFIHAEFMTHREFSRNASSSRAIPVAKQLQMIIDDPAAPEVWGSNKPGMQAGDELTGFKLWAAKRLWGLACRTNVLFARAMNALGVHKQIVNRLCEPYAHIKVLVTSTNWSNFLALRDHPDAQPEIRILAKAVRKALLLSTPNRLKVGEWHLPYVALDEQLNYELDACLQMSVARCARVSYVGFDGKSDPAKDFKLFTQLVGGDPKHASPTEHQAQAIDHRASVDITGNFRGWAQYRKTIENEAYLNPNHWKYAE